MSVRKRGDVWWYDFTLEDGLRRRGSTGQHGKAAALKVEARERERAALGEVSAAKVWTLEAAAAHWFAMKQDGKRSASTTAYRVEIMLRLLGRTRRVQEIDTPDIADAIQARRFETTRQGKAPTNATVNRDLIEATTRPILRHCRRVLKVRNLPEIDWSELRLKEPKERVRDFTPGELAAWEAELPVHHRALRNFFARYGVRLKEAFFPLAAVNTDSWTITIRGAKRKNGRPHVVPLLEDDARDMAARLGRARAADLDTVWFKEEKDGTLSAINWRGFQSASKAALKRAGITDARPTHDLRHHAATATLRAGANLKVVQALLGHENIASTARYAHASTDDVLRALRHTHGTIDQKAVNS